MMSDQDEEIQTHIVSLPKVRLRSCPFCDGWVVIYVQPARCAHTGRHSFAYTPTCDECGVTLRPHMNLELGVDAWNRRKPVDEPLHEAEYRARSELHWG